MAQRLALQAAAGVDQQHGRRRGRGRGRHVARVLLVAGRVGEDELAPRGVEVAVRDVDRDALLALGLQAVDQQRDVEVVAAGAPALAVDLRRAHQVLRHAAGVVQQAADQRALAVVDAAAGHQPQQVLGVLAVVVVAERRVAAHQK